MADAADRDIAACAISAMKGAPWREALRQNWMSVTP
jgi:hypothetical protein